MMKLSRPTLAAFAAPLTLALAACGGGDAVEGEAPSGDAIAAIPAPEGSNWGETAITTELGGVQVGNPDAPIKLVEYASHTCSHCATFAEEADTKLHEYVATGVVSYELRNQIHDALDLTIAVLARCGEPSAFQPLAGQAWANLSQIVTTAQENGEALQAAINAQDDTRFQQIAQVSGLLDFFAARGISRDQANICLADTAAAEKIAENSTTQSDELGVTGTPTFFLNGSKLNGTAWSIIEPALQDAGAR